MLQFHGISLIDVKILTTLHGRTEFEGDINLTESTSISKTQGR